MLRLRITTVVVNVKHRVLVLQKYKVFLGLFGRLPFVSRWLLIFLVLTSNLSCMLVVVLIVVIVIPLP